MGEVFYNSRFINEDELLIKTSNRAFNYGDGFFETIKIINAKPFNFKLHYTRFSLACKILKLNDFKSESHLYEIICRLIDKNKIINGSCRVHVNRRGAGRYLPSTNSLDLFIKTSNGRSFLKINPISLCIFSNECKTKGHASNIKSINALPSILAAIYAKENDFDNALLKNTDGNLIEASNSNLFIIKDKMILTPPLSEGCIDGTMRRWVIDKLNIIEQPLSQLDVKNADEVFITNAISGITSVEFIYFENKKAYKTNFSKELQNELISSSLGF